MEYLLAGLGIITALLILKIRAMKQSLRQIRKDFSDRSGGESNGLLSVSSRDRDLCRLASDMNEALKKQRQAYLLYHQGDRELKSAITHISHDLRTPLTAISGYLELLKAEEKSETAGKYLSIIEERTGHMKKLCEEMFAYSLISAGEEEELPLETVDVNRMLEDCILQYHGALEEKGIALTVDISEKRILRSLNKMQMERVFSNLMSNALKYSDGDLSISLDDSGMICFANGAAGLSALEAERLFGRFYTVENAQNSTGLGLAIAKAFVERMQGTMQAKYREGRLYILLSFPEERDCEKTCHPE